jgi:adenylate kinase family enzyme
MCGGGVADFGKLLRMASIGTAATWLVVLRGNSGAGKSTTARALRERLSRGAAWVEQDYLRRIVLKEHDTPSGVNIGLISQTVRYALDHHYNVILEGILSAARYSDMLRTLREDHLGRTFFYYFDVSFAETTRRHTTRPQSKDFGIDAMQTWYQERDLLSFVEETLVPEGWSLDQTVERILLEVRAADGTVATSPGAQGELRHLA